MTSDSHIYSIIFIIDTCQLPISLSTVSWRLNKAGVYGRVAAVKEFLIPAQKQARLAFAQEYIGRNQRWWNSVTFSDEKTSLVWNGIF
jgi:hypothetical protein